MNPEETPPDDALPDPSGTSPDEKNARPAGLRALSGVRLVLDRMLAGVCIIFFVALVAIVSWQVFTRQVLGNSAPWTQEAAQYTFVILALMGAALVFSERGHIAVEILVDKLPRTAQKIVAVVVQALVIFFALFVFIVGGSRVAANAWDQTTSTLPLSVGQIYLVLPIAGVLIAFYSIYHLIGVLAGVEDPTPELDDTTEAV